MKNVTRHEGVLTILQRLPSSKAGNPRYRAFADQGNGTGWTFATAPDDPLGYRLPNFDGKRVEVEIGTRHGVRTLAHIKLA